MGLYDLPTFKYSKKKKEVSRLIILSICVSSLFGFLAGGVGGIYFYLEAKEKLNIELVALIKNEIIKIEVKEEHFSQISREEAIIKAVEEISPAVVSIVITKELPIIDDYYYDPWKEFEEFFGPSPFKFENPQDRPKGTEKKEIGGGTGFIISQDGMILTNKHVVFDTEADYTVFTNDGRKFPAKVLARDPFQDLAVIKIEQKQIVDDDGRFFLETFPVVSLGNSDELKLGQTVITIGNALGEFRNTISAGVISGLGRTITASGGGFVEILEDVIQTDAAINRGNSGGPLINLKGEVIGINTAMVIDAQSIGFAILINKAKRDIEQIKEMGKIVYPFLGIRYVLVNEKVKKENDLSVDYGALIVKRGSGEPAVTPDSAAEKAGLREKDIVLEFNSEKITTENTLAKIIMKYNPGDEIILKVLREEEEIIIEATLGERSG